MQLDPMMQPASFTRVEGGEWKPFFDSRIMGGPGGEVHAILFANGAIFDTVNGWRIKPRIRVKMGRAVV